MNCFHNVKLYGIKKTFCNKNSGYAKKARFDGMNTGFVSTQVGSGRWLEQFWGEVLKLDKTSR
ncbi:MAG: hypothetical protein EAZ61_03770 [Oscillatoriales cyanobacterium]|nr:MAG: hypothetical protein EAZ61_03770 [Oscillatoriales cyanobacterium]